MNGFVKLFFISLVFMSFAACGKDSSNCIAKEESLYVQNKLRNSILKSDPSWLLTVYKPITSPARFDGLVKSNVKAFFSGLKNKKRRSIALDAVESLSFYESDEGEEIKAEQLKENTCVTVLYFANKSFRKFEKTNDPNPNAVPPRFYVFSFHKDADGLSIYDLEQNFWDIYLKNSN